MTEDTESMVLELLRRIREDIAGLREEIVDVKLRLSAVEQNFGLLHSAISQIQVSMAAYQRRADRIDMRTDSFENRLDRLEGKSETTESRLARLEERLKQIDA